MLPVLPEITAAFSVIKSLKDLAASSDNHKFIGLINDLYESLMSAREKILQLQEENIQLKQDLKESCDRKALKEDIEFRGFAVFKKSTNEGPFCNPCWSDKEKLIPLHEKYSFHFECGVCKGIVCSDRKGYQAIIDRAQAIGLPNW